MDPDQSRPAFPLDLADRCVKCGLCLPHCPTYRLDGIEGASPRGRIALMQGVAEGRLEPGPALMQHIETCLGCRACESACPAGVPYGEILDAGRAMLAGQGWGRAPTLMTRLLRRPRLAARLAMLARVTGLTRLGRRLPGPGRAFALLPPQARPFRGVRTPGDGRRGEVLFFTGCVGRALDGATLEDAVKVLAAAGWKVRAPDGQVCCGAIDQHGGRPGEASRLAGLNAAAFSGDAPVATCATGCAATLAEYGRLAPDAGGALARRVRDVAELLADAELPLGEPPYRRIALHGPCTQRYVTRSGAATRRLLERLPGAHIRELPAGCCGAAGEMFLTRPELSNAILEPTIEAILAEPADVVVTSNIGCMMHLAAGLARRGRPLPVLHPVSLVARSLTDS